MNESEDQEKSGEEEVKQESYDIWMIIAVGLLLIIGLLMVFSASSIFAARKFGTQYHFIWRQAFFACIGCFLASFVARLPREFIYKRLWLWLLLSLAVLGMTMFPSQLSFCVVTSHKSTRWISLGLFNIQPMEFAKIAFALYLANFYAYKREKLDSIREGLLPPFILLLLFIVILVKQPDYGATLTFIALWAVMNFVGMVNLKYILGIFGAVAFLVALLFLTAPYHPLGKHIAHRLEAFGKPFEYAQGSGYQVAQSLLSFGIGGTSGVGIGASSQKAFFLPEAHTDFIMSVLAEETGFIGISCLLLLFFFFFVRCYRIIVGQEERRDRLVAIALTCLLAIGVLANFSVAMGVLPAKGVAMPFISYGGSSLLANLIIVGLLLNLSKSIKH